jgi:hypothetical protein
MLFFDELVFFRRKLAFNRSNFCVFFAAKPGRPDWANFRLFNGGLLWANFENYRSSPNYRAS